MSTVDDPQSVLAAKFEVILPHLDERQRRVLLGAEARSIGRGGIRLVARAAGVREATVSLGVSDLDEGAAPLGRVRRVGGGRKRVVDVDAGLCAAVLALVEPDMRGDPMSPLRWTTKSTRNLATEVTRLGHRVSADTVGDLLRAEGFSLQGNAKIRACSGIQTYHRHTRTNLMLGRRYCTGRRSAATSSTAAPSLCRLRHTWRWEMGPQ